MTNEQILKKTIEKAYNSGWNGFDKDMKNWSELENWQKEAILNLTIEGIALNTIIFSHNFAKAVWGDKWKDGDSITTPMSDILSMENIKPWQHHLRQMVLLTDDEKFKYLEKFL